MSDCPECHGKGTVERTEAVYGFKTERVTEECKCRRETIRGIEGWTPIERFSLIVSNFYPGFQMMAYQWREGE